MYYGQAETRYQRARPSRRIVIISGDNTRTYTFSPLMLFGGLALALVISIGFLGATAYLVFRDDLFTLVRTRNADMQVAYEDRIARLRSEIDKISSRQILDQVSMDDKMERLLAAQAGIVDRQKAVNDLVEKAAGLGLIASPAPERQSLNEAADPAVTGSVGSAYASTDAARASRIDAQFDALTRPADPAPAPRTDVAALRTGDGKPDFKAIARDLLAIDAEQSKAVAAIATAANRRVDEAVATIDDLGIRVHLPAETKTDSDDAVGGPFVPLGGAMALSEAMDEAGKAFDRLATVKGAVAGLPLSRPLPGADMTSNYGSRRDPFLGSLAFHAGIDFRSPTGTDVRPTAAGVITNAGWAGGYGNMVEVDHGGGLVTRYGHLSRIDVSVGDKVTRSTVIGAVGSTGRSTGPHLHYETRVDGNPINPVIYINAGQRLSRLLG
jgi:murein DD-endopeptidase MepM/ murein hydrolase activator NlpD